VAGLSPRQARALFEVALDAVGWPWSRRISLLIDELLRREERVL